MRNFFRMFRQKRNGEAQPLNSANELGVPMVSIQVSQEKNEPQLADKTLRQHIIGTLKFSKDDDLDWLDRICIPGIATEITLHEPSQDDLAQLHAVFTSAKEILMMESREHITVSSSSSRYGFARDFVIVILILLALAISFNEYAKNYLDSDFNPINGTTNHTNNTDSTPNNGIRSIVGDILYSLNGANALIALYRLYNASNVVRQENEKNSKELEILIPNEKRPKDSLTDVFAKYLEKESDSLRKLAIVETVLANCNTALQQDRLETSQAPTDDERRENNMRSASLD